MKGDNTVSSKYSALNHFLQACAIFSDSREINTALISVEQQKITTTIKRPFSKEILRKS